MKNGLKKLLIAGLFLFVGSTGYALSADSVTTNGVVVFTTGSSTENSTSSSTTESTTSSSSTESSTSSSTTESTTSSSSTESSTGGSTTESTTSSSTTESTTSDSPTKDSTDVEAYPETGENVGTSLFLRSLGLVLLAIVAAVLVRKFPTKK
ncbi:hypothetical protein [Enterococcus faecalis]|uniref:hypothetical protein n=1 Tax=Enterococcus faecalis TaxID=1351 RepID=UPI00053BEBDC|nr:hypothetical protein [Enterococcus faecalis]KII50407.1 hypothetical protein QH72_01785 [Enterococcus faecalis]